MKKALIIFNPVAGANKIRNIPKIIQDSLNQNDYSYEWFETMPVASQPLDQFINQKFDKIIVSGGDGTVREVVTFMVQNNIKTPLGIIAQGTANLVATSLNIPVFSIKKAIDFALHKNGIPLDVMVINEKHIGLIAAGQGYDSVFIQGATRSLKRKYGFIAYIISFLKTFFLYPSKNYKIVIDGKRYYATGKLAAVFNLLSLGNTKIGNHISPQDGLLNIAVFNPKSLYDILKISISFLLRIKRIKKPKMQIFEGKNVSINMKKGKWIQIDGETFKGKNLQIKVKPQAINIIYEKQFNN